MSMTRTQRNPPRAVQLTDNPKAGRRGQRWMHFVRGWTNQLFAWVDQAIISATSFATLIVLGSWTDPSTLGAYAVAASVLAMLIASQDALITRPYSIRLHHGTPTEHAFSALMLSMAFAASSTLLLCAVALVFNTFETGRAAAPMAAMLASIIPLILLREFARRYAFAHLRPVQATMLDAIVAVLNLALLSWLGWTGRLSALTALGSLGIACGVGALGWLFLMRTQFAFRWAKIPGAFRQSWRLGKWLLSGHLAAQAQGYVTLWLSLVIGGAVTTGIYTASMSILSFANPLLFGFYNTLTPRSVRALRLKGPAGLRRQAAGDSLSLALLMGPFCLLIFLFGADMLRFFYPAAGYGADTHLLTILALATSAGAVGVPASAALSSAERTRIVAAVMIAAAALNLSLVSILMTHFGLLGAAYGMLLAEVTASLAVWAAFLMSFHNLQPMIHRSTAISVDAVATSVPAAT